MVTAQETTLQDVLEATKQYIVPLYQRPYQWGKNQLNQLWEDIVCFVNFLSAKRARKTRPPQRVFRPCERQVIRACLTR